ncbi:unnamed protein product [Paramecium pentaurelia]|uniref:Uncharacterized protein n=1 Tax=Paramecium pentaurelia TaxID=43138 RepID=A0A8S1X1U7_9CILI|nr:unnamed protein product [Paramecium pentaurelia]
MYQQILPAAVGTFLTSVFGHFWYSDSCFGLQWKAGAQIKQPYQNDNSNGQIIEILARFVKSYCFILFYLYLNLKDYSSTFQLILIIVGGIILPNGLSALAWEMKRKEYILIQTSEHVASLLILAICAEISQKST